jgi:hypothetical protein
VGTRLDRAILNERLNQLGSGVEYFHIINENLSRMWKRKARHQRARRRFGSLKREGRLEPVGGMNVAVAVVLDDWGTWGRRKGGRQGIDTREKTDVQGDLLLFFG